MEGDDTVYHHHHHHAPITMVTGTNPAQTQPEASIAGETPPPAGKVERSAGGGGGVAPPPPPPHHADPRWDGGGGAGLNKGGLLPPLVDAQAPAQPQATEAPGAAAAGGGGGGVSVKMATTVLQPFCLGDSPVVLSGGQSICLGDGPVVLPIHLQMSGGAPGAVPSLHGQMGALHGQMGATPYFMTSQGAVSLPLVLDPQLLQHLSSQMASGCPALPLQNNVLCQNASLTFGLPPPLPPPPPPSLDQKSSGGSSSPDSNLLSLLQNPAFAAILQDLFTSQAAASSTACQSPGSAPGATDPFASAFFTSPPPPPHAPPPLSHPYASPLAPLVPPATLLVPYPVVIPLPVPLPIPLPIPVPVAPRHGGAGEDSKGDVVRRSVCTVSRSTQTTSTSTCTRDATSSSSSSSSHTFSPRFAAAPPQPQPPHAGPPPHSSGEGEVLDLSVRLCPAAVQPKLEFPSSPPQQDDVLDLSVAGSGCKKKYIQPAAAAVPSSRASSLGAGGGHREFGGREELVSASGGGGTAALSLGVLRPMECVPTTLDSKQLLVSGLASLEFSRQHKWLQVDAGGALSRSEALGGGGSLAGGNLEIVSASSQAAANRVIVSVKDAIPAFLCGKIKGLSGVSTKNFSIKRDGGGGGGGGGVGVAGPVQQLYGPLPPPPPPPPASNGTAAPPGGLPPSPAGEHHDPGGDPLGRKAPKNRALKVKKVGSQEIHFLPIKKQRLAAFLPRK